VRDRGRPGFVVVAWLAGLVLGGCGASLPSSSFPAASPAAVPSEVAAVDACGLVPGMDALLARTAVAPPSAVRIAPNERCTWVYGSNPSRDVSLTVGPAANHGATIDAFGDGERVEAGGDDARWWPGNRVLSVASGGRSVQVAIRLEPEAPGRELAVAIAAEAIRRLP
jgi:hypothetical protein